MAAYSPQDSLQSAADHVREILLGLTQANNRAYGRLCGFVDGTPSFARIDKVEGVPGVVEPIVTPMNDLVTVGWYHEDSLLFFNEAIHSKMTPKAAIKRSIERLQGREGIALPADEFTLEQ